MKVFWYDEKIVRFWKEGLSMKIRVFSLVLTLCFLVTAAWASFCSNCGEKARESDKFCAQCGKKLVSEATVPTKVQPLPPQAKISKIPVIVPATRRGTRASPFIVRTKYLSINGRLVFQGHVFFIADIVGEQARIWSCDGPFRPELLMGWVTLDELEKRSTFRRSGTVYTIEPSIQSNPKHKPHHH